MMNMSWIFILFLNVFFSIQEGKAYVKQAGKKKATTGRKRTGGRAKKSSK